MLSYEGIFFERETADLIHSLEKEKLPNVNDELHCTFKYHPQGDEIFDELVGEEIEVILIGYGHNERVSSFEIELPKELLKYYINYDERNREILHIPHITASLNDNVKAEESKYLIYEPLERPYRVKGKFGYWIKDEDKEYVSYDPYKSKKKALKKNKPDSLGG